MKPLFALILNSVLVFISLCSSAQTDTTYFDKDWNKSNLSNAKYYRLAIKTNDGKYKVEDYFISNNQLQMSGYFSSLNPEVKDGDFVYYNENGIKSQEGKYENDKKFGLFKDYNDTTGVLLGICNYSKDKRNGIYERYFRNGKKEVEGKYRNNDRAGTWKHYHEDVDTLWFVEVFNDDGDRKSLTSYYKSGKLKREEADRKYVAISGQCWDEKGNQMKFTQFEKMPDFPKLEAYIMDHLGYPASSLEKKIQGRVIVKFVINEDGHVSDVTVTKGVESALDEEAVQVVKNMPPWKPGIQDDKPVRVYFTLPISFKL